MKPILFKQLLIGQQFTLGGVLYTRVKTFYNNCCTPEYNAIQVKDDTIRGLMKPHATVEVADEKGNT